MAISDFQTRAGLIVNGNLITAKGGQPNVGINTSSPGAALDVVGTVNASGNVALGGTLIAGATTINSTALSEGANIIITTTTITVGNSTANLFANSILVQMINSTATLNLQPTQVVLGTSVINASAVAEGANVFLTTTGLSCGNSTVNLFANSIEVLLSGNLFVNSIGLFVGNSTVNLSANSSSLLLGTSVTINTSVIQLSGNNALFTGISNNITTGYTFTAFNAGTKNSGTFTPAPASGNYQFISSNGAFTLAAPASDCAIDILFTNGTGAGAVTFSGFTANATTAGALTTTSGNKFIVSIRRINSIPTYSIYALQ